MWANAACMVLGDSPLAGADTIVFFGGRAVSSWIKCMKEFSNCQHEFFESTDGYTPKRTSCDESHTLKLMDLMARMMTSLSARPMMMNSALTFNVTKRIGLRMKKFEERVTDLVFKDVRR